MSERGDRWRRRVASLTAFAPPLLALAAVGLRRPSFDEGPSGQTLVTFWTSAAINALLIAALGVVVLLAGWSFARVRFRPYGMAAVAAGAWAIFLLCGLGAWMGWGAPHMSHQPAAVGPDGVAYRVGYAGEEGTWLLRDVEHRWDRDVVEVLTDGRGAPDVLVLRPAGAPDGTIRFDPEGRVYLVAGAWVMPFDPHGGVLPLRSQWDDASLFRRRAVPDVSPFAALAADEQGDVEDVKRMVDSLRSPTMGDRTRARPPLDRHLLDALDSPNPWIVETAKTFIRAGGEKLYPEATRRLAR